ncbi:cytochrome P450, partial [Striga asiatica]
EFHSTTFLPASSIRYGECNVIGRHQAAATNKNRPATSFSRSSRYGKATSNLSSLALWSLGSFLNSSVSLRHSSKFSGETKSEATLISHLVWAASRYENCLSKLLLKCPWFYAWNHKTVEGLVMDWVNDLNIRPSANANRQKYLVHGYMSIQNKELTIVPKLPVQLDSNKCA